MSKSAMPAAADPRALALNRWLRNVDPDFTPAQPMGSDASFRRYFRSQRGGISHVIMDAPPEREDTAPFLRVGGLLHTMGLRAPRILANDPDQGFILLEDLGDRTFTRALADGVPEPELYRLATATLLTLQARWHERGAAGLPEAEALPRYDTGLLLQEARLFLEWYWPEVQGTAVPRMVEDAFEQAWRGVLDALPDLPGTLVLRDFHVDNLMLLPADGGTGACGLLDFQDAVLGSPAYDLVSLLEDARRDVSPDVVTENLETTLAAGRWPAADFLHHYRVLGAQRTVKIIGIFTRLARRDHKPGYQVHQPRLWRLLERSLKQPELEPVATWFRRHFRRDGRPCTR
nr:phosphotransferase [Thioalkalivibrio sp.]